MASALDETIAPDRARARARPGAPATDLLLVAMSLIWGINYTVIKSAMAWLGPLAFNGTRIALAAVALVLIAVVARRPWPSRRDALALLGLGVLGNGAYQLCFIEGLARTRAGDTALVLASAPAIIAILGGVFRIERISRRAMLGIALSVAGIALVIRGGAAAESRGSSIAGDAIVLAGTVCWSVFSVLLARYTSRVSLVPLSALTMIGGALPLGLVALPEISRAAWGAAPPALWGALAYSGLGALVVAYFFWYHGVRMIGPTRTAIYSNLQPAVALLAAWIALHEVPTVWQTLGAATIIAGVVLTRS